MSRRFKGTVAIVGALALCLSLFAVGVSGKSKIRRVGSSTQVETSTRHGKRNITVTGLVQSSVPKCERDRSVLLYQDGPGGTFVGAALGHGVSEGGANRGEFTIAGVGAEEDPGRSGASASRRSAARSRVKGKRVICKRGVSVQFPGDFG